MNEIVINILSSIHFMEFAPMMIIIVIPLLVFCILLIIFINNLERKLK